MTIIGGMLLCLYACTNTGDPPTAAELVLVNGGIYTLDRNHPWVQAVAVRDGAIVAVGANSEIEGFTGSDTRVIDLRGQMALPGFHDPHTHSMQGGYRLVGCSIESETTLEAVLAKIETCASEQPGDWLEVHGLDLALFPPEGPNKATLDAIIADRPVIVRGSSLHSSWVNSRAIELAGINAETPDPYGGKIERDPATGEPTGMFRDTAKDMFHEAMPAKSVAFNRAAMQAAIAHFNSLGITSIVEIAYGKVEWEVLQDLERSGELSVRVVSPLVYGPFAFHKGAEFERVLGQRHDYRSQRVNTDAIKFFLDGVLEGETAALLEPYVDMGDHDGELNFEPAALVELLTRFDAMGLQVHMHAIGDRAVRAGLDAVEAARRHNGDLDNRHFIVHMQLVHPDDYPRFGELGVTANFQAVWAYPDQWVTELNLPVVGRERMDRMYPLGQIHRAGGRIAGSSDWPITTAYPMDAIETAVRRQDPWEEIEDSLNPGAAVELATMIEAYTINGAWLMHQKEQLGSIEVGKRADIVVLDRNLFAIPATEINEANVVWTIFDGEVVFTAHRVDE